MARRRSSPHSGVRGPSQRQLRAGELVRHALVEVLAREGLRDPDLDGVSVTIGEVRCSPDLKQATVFCSPLGDDSREGRQRLADALNRASGYIRGRLGARIDLKHTPGLRFVGDESYDEAAAIERLMQRPEIKRDLD